MKNIDHEKPQKILPCDEFSWVFFLSCRITESLDHEAARLISCHMASGCETESECRVLQLHCGGMASLGNVRGKGDQLKDQLYMGRMSMLHLLW